jgi:uncharacterized protein involved in outer membrane biogenesis
LKKLLYALLAVFLLLLAAVLLLPSLIDWNAYKDQLVAQVEQATGRDITVDGPVSLSLLPSPAFSAQRVTLANVEGASDRPMARVADLRVRVALTPLLQGQVEVERLVLVEPQVLLERTAEGRANWRLRGGQGRAPGEPDPLDSGLLGQVSLQDVQVVDGTLRFVDAASGLDRRITAVDARLSARSLSGPFEARGSLAAAGVVMRLEGQLGRLDSGGPAPYSLRLQLNGADAHANLGGALTTGQTTRLQGDLELRGSDLSDVLARFTGRRAHSYPVQLAQTFSGESKLTLAEGVLKAQDLSLQLGDTGADGSLRVTFPGASERGRTNAVADLTVQRLDLDRLIAMQREDAGGTQSGDTPSGDTQSGGGDGETAFTLPPDLRAELNVNIGAILYRDRVIRQGRANAVLEDGTVTLNQAMALLPGSSDLAVFGTLAAQDGQPVFDGRLEAASDNLRGMLEWLGVAFEGVPEDRLRRMELLADLQARASQVTLTNIDLDVDTTDLEGGVAIALRRRPGFGIGLTADKLNLDAYLPARGAAADGGEAGSGEGNGGARGGPPLGWLGGFDANFDLRAGQLTYAGTTAQDVKLDATLHNQALTIREASVGNLAGAAARLDGKLTELIGLDPQIDVNVDLDVENVPRFTGALGWDDSLPAGLGPVALVGTAQGGVAQAKVDGTLTALGGTATFQGDVEPMAAPAAFDVVLALQHDSLRALSQNIPDMRPLAEAAGALDLTARVAGTTRSFGTDNVKGQVGPVKVSGPVSLDLTGERPQLNAMLETGDLPLAAFAAAGAGGTGDTAAAQEAGGADAVGDGAGPRWPAQPLPLAALRALDLDLSLDTEAIVLADGSRLEEAQLAATLRDGVLDLDRVSGRLFDGEVSVNGTLDTRETAAGSLVVELTQVASGPLLGRAFGLRALDGPIDLRADLNAKGASPNALIASLAGEGELSGRVTVAPDVFLGPQAGQLLDENEDGDGRLGQQLSNMLGDALGAEVRIGGLTQALDFVGTAFTQERARLSGTFAVAEGIVTTSDLTLDGLDGRAETRGEVNLPTWRLDTTTELFRAKDAPDDPFVVTRQTGPLDAPNVAITGGAFQEQLTPEAIRDQTRDDDGEGDAAPGTGRGGDAGADTGSDSGEPASAPEGGGDAARRDAGAQEAAPRDAGSEGTGGEDAAGAGSPGSEPDAQPAGDDAPAPKRAEDIIRGVLDQLQNER